MPPPRIAVIVLAAGRSTRFATANGQKLIAPLAGAPVIRWSVASAVEAEVGEVFVVTGPGSPSLERALDGLAVRTIHAPDAGDGMSASLRRGVQAVQGSVDALIVALGDQPTIRPDAYRRVAATWARTGAAIVTPLYPSTTAPAHPTLFAATVFEELTTLSGDVGARSVIARSPARVATASMDWPAPHDIDTPDDLHRVAAELSRTTDES